MRGIGEKMNVGRRGLGISQRNVAECGGMDMVAECRGMDGVAECGGMDGLAECRGMDGLAECGGMDVVTECRGMDGKGMSAWVRECIPSSAIGGDEVSRT